MTASAGIAAEAPAAARWQVVEDHVIILSAHTRCPSKDACDIGSAESYEEYVRRHLADHDIPSINPATGQQWDFVDAERNLSLWCLFYFHKWVQGNMSLLPEPGWEDADFLANGTFTDDDLEVGVPWDQRQFRLKPYSERVVDLARYKRMRKMTKVRETQKSSWCKAFITWRHVRAYFVENNIYFRVMVISAFSALARDGYLEVFSVMWAQHEKLVALYGKIEHTMRWREDKPDEAEERVVALLDWKKTKIKDGLQLRWNVNSKKNTGQSVTSLFVAGVTTATTGRRWDLIVVDDPCIDKNSGSEAMRDKVKRKAAELRKELSGIGELVWLNTPHHLDDASAQIDAKFADEFHIIYRPARWGPKGNYNYYWQRDGLCSVKTDGIECMRPRHEHASCHALGEVKSHPFFGRVVWDEARIEKEERQVDFYSQVLLLVRDERMALFHERDFEVISTASAPEEVRFGLGRPLTDDEAEILRRLKVSILAFNMIDTAGKEKKTTTGCRNAIVGVRFDSYGRIVVTHVHYGYWSPEQECEAMWASCVRNQPEAFEYEVSGAHEKYARGAHADWQGRKSQEMKRPVAMPIVYINVAEGTPENQFKRIEKAQPYATTGRIKILKDAGSEEDIKSFIAEFCDFPWSNRRDGPDAFSRCLKRLEAFQFKEPTKEAEAATAGVLFDPESAVFTMEAHTVAAAIAQLESPSRREWADQGRYEEETPFEDRDSIPADPRSQRGRAA